jgi:hypothetical protein
MPSEQAKKLHLYAVLKIDSRMQDLGTELPSQLPPNAQMRHLNRFSSQAGRKSLQMIKPKRKGPKKKKTK